MKPHIARRAHWWYTQTPDGAWWRLPRHWTPATSRAIWGSYQWRPATTELSLTDRRPATPRAAGRQLLHPTREDTSCQAT